ncbi:MAG: metal ABC transporter permease [Candidatus Limnocylindria bacterium]|nr:MAG: manganese ABC transporter permease [Chloroflexota bacterium]
MGPILDPLGYDFFLRALAASAVVGLVCAVVGSYMVLRGLAFMGDALSHAAFPGVVVAYMLKGPFYIGAAVASVATALLIGWVTRRGGLRGDTAIGVLFAGMFALGVFLFSLIPNYVGDLFGFLFGEVLGIGFGDLLALVALAVAVLAAVAILWKELLYATFDPLGAAASGLPVARLDYLFLALIAITIVVSLQAVGIILVVAMLVTPAATAQLLTRSFGRLLLVAAGIGIVAPIVGLYVSYWADAASGATIVLVETALFLVVLASRQLAGRRPHVGLRRSLPAEPDASDAGGDGFAESRVPRRSPPTSGSGSVALDEPMPSDPQEE